MKIEFKRKMLILPRGMAKEIRDTLGVSYPTIRDALAGITYGEKSKRVRKLAMDKLKELENKQL